MAIELVKINSTSCINPDNVIGVMFLQDKLKTVVVCKDKMIVESDFTFDETIRLLSKVIL